MAYLRIGELARLTETNNETLRFYESRGLLNEPRRTDAGYRLYTKDDVARVEFIVRARRMGFSLKEISELLSIRVDPAHSTCGEVKELAESKLAAIEDKISELTEMKEALLRITDACCGGAEPAVNCTILHALDASSAVKAAG
ncbi:MAG: Zn(2+)-responsive transcriptional regulator [Pseudomonadota bacterium]